MWRRGMDLEEFPGRHEIRTQGMARGDLQHHVRVRMVRVIRSEHQRMTVVAKLPHAPEALIVDPHDPELARKVEPAVHFPEPAGRRPRASPSAGRKCREDHSGDGA